MSEERSRGLHSPTEERVFRLFQSSNASQTVTPLRATEFQQYHSSHGVSHPMNSSSTESLGSMLVPGTLAQRMAQGRSPVLPRRTDARRIMAGSMSRHRCRHLSRRSNSSPALDLSIPQLCLTASNRMPGARHNREDRIMERNGIVQILSDEIRYGPQVEVETPLFEQPHNIHPSPPLFLSRDAPAFLLPSVASTWHQDQLGATSRQARSILPVRASETVQTQWQAVGPQNLEVSVRDVCPSSISRRNTECNIHSSRNSINRSLPSYRLLESNISNGSYRQPEAASYSIPFSASPSNAPLRNIPSTSHHPWPRWGGPQPTELAGHERPFWLTPVGATLLENVQDHPYMSPQYPETSALRSMFFPPVVCEPRGMALQELRQATAVRTFEGLPLKDVVFGGSLLRSRSSVQPIMGEKEDCDANDTKQVGSGTHSEIQDLVGDSKRVCAICCADFLSGEPVRAITLCGHRYHVFCVDRWFEDNSTCPICRSNLKVPIRKNEDETVLEEHPMNDIGNNGSPDEENIQVNESLESIQDRAENGFENGQERLENHRIGSGVSTGLVDVMELTADPVPPTMADFDNLNQSSRSEAQNDSRASPSPREDLTHTPSRLNFLFKRSSTEERRVKNERTPSFMKRLIRSFSTRSKSQR